MRMTAKLMFGPVLAIGLVLSGVTIAHAQSTPQAGDSDLGSHMRGHGPVDRAEMHKKMCADNFAKGAARRAYLEARLELTAAQKPFFDKWSQGLASAAQSRKVNCLANVPKEGAPPTILERHAMMEKRLAEQEKTLKASLPSLEALYQALNPDQRKVLDHMHEHRAHHKMVGMHPGRQSGMDNGGHMEGAPKN